MNQELEFALASTSEVSSHGRPEAGQMFWGNIRGTSADFRNTLKNIRLRPFHYLHVQAKRLRGAVLERKETTLSAY
jgi:hypothetical protein